MDLWILAGVPVTSFIVALSGALMPGPLLTITVGEATRRGFWAGPLIILGHGILEFILVALLLIGLGGLLNTPVVLGTVGLVGGGVLAWMGLGLVKASRTGRLNLEGEAPSGLHPVWSGMFLSLANPYWLIWWLTIGLGYVIFAAKFGLVGVALFFAGHILADLAWYTLVSATVAYGRNFFTDRLYRGFLAGCGCFLFLFSGYFGFQGVKFLLTT
ncbi:MAG: LysE family transporter [Desulfobaccales bacterium]